MSVQSWKNEFYPISALEAAQTKDRLGCIDHSLTKWRGARPENLQKHDVTFKLHTIKDLFKEKEEKEEEQFLFDAVTCSLCQYDDLFFADCRSCPIYLSTEKTCCESYDKSGKDPTLMIELLEEVREDYVPQISK